MIRLAILGVKSQQRYAIWRTVTAACALLADRCPDLQVEITEIDDAARITQITPVLIYPSLMVNGRLVSIGRYPKREEVAAWLMEALENR